jgi:hypothetical protein
MVMLLPNSAPGVETPTGRTLNAMDNFEQRTTDQRTLANFYCMNARLPQNDVQVPIKMALFQ